LWIFNHDRRYDRRRRPFSGGELHAMISFDSARLSRFLDGLREAMTTPAHAELAEAAKSTGRAVQGLLTDTEEGQQSALKAALASPTSLISEFQNYRVVIANPVNAFIGAVNSGGILVTDGENSVSFDPLSGILKTDGEVHARGSFYWDLGARDDQDGLFIVPKDAP
jgi:hypothetical protein